MATAESLTTDWTTCPICLEVFDNPKSLPCIHGFCLKCLERHFEDNMPGDEVPCPLCRKEFKIPPEGLGGLQHHFLIQHLVEARNVSTKSTDEQLCQACLEEDEDGEGNVSAATMYCVDCSESLCEKCSRPHRRTTMKGGAHQVRPLGAELEQERIQLRGRSCDKHKDKQVELFCHDCSENICVLCFAVNHRNHSTIEISGVAESLKLRIGAYNTNILAGISSVREQLEQTRKELLKFTSHVDSTEKMVVEAGVAIKQLVDTQVAECLLELSSVKSESTKQAEIVQERLQLTLVAMESFNTYSRELLDKGRPSDITRAASELHKRATELLDSDVTSVQYCPPHVTFTPPDVTQLTPLQLIGKLSVSDNGEFEEQQQVSDVPPCQLQEEMSGQSSVVSDNVSQLEQQMKECHIVPVRHTLLQGDGVLGVTSLDNLIFVLRRKASEQIAVYDVESYRLQRKITVHYLQGARDIAACPHYQCLYVSGDDEWLHKVALLNDNVTNWRANGIPHFLSVTDTHSVLVTYSSIRKIKEYSTDGKLLRQIQLPRDVVSPYHTIQLSSGEFVVCHGDRDDRVHRVCLIGSDGRVVKSYGGPKGSNTQQLYLPAHLAVDRNGFVFVADVNNDRVLLLSPALTFVHLVLSRKQLKWTPLRLWLDSDGRRLYVAVNKWEGDDYTAGKVVVVNV